MLDTQEVHSFRLQCQNEQITLIDTRGFSDSKVSDIQNLLELSTYLSRSSLPPIHGIIFLHSIKETKFTGTAAQNLRLLQAICGESFFAHVVLATTMWDDLPLSAEMGKFESREWQLREDFWGSMIARGAKTARFTGTRSSVIGMVTALLDVNYRAPQLQLQDEIEKWGSLHLTSAGKVVCEKPNLLLAKVNKQLRDGSVAGDWEDAEGREERLELEGTRRRIMDELELLREDLRHVDRSVEPTCHIL
jgi:hypothetical protein